MILQLCFVNVEDSAGLCTLLDALLHLLLLRVCIILMKFTNVFHSVSPFTMATCAIKFEQRWSGTLFSIPAFISTMLGFAPNTNQHLLHSVDHSPSVFESSSLLNRDWLLSEHFIPSCCFLALSCAISGSQPPFRYNRVPNGYKMVACVEPRYRIILSAC